MITYSKPPFISILRPWHPLNQLRLLWWLAVDRARFDAYRLQVGEEAIRSAMAWLVGFLICVPSLIVVLGISLRLPSTTDASLEVSLLRVGAVVIAWLVIGLLSTNIRKWVRGIVFMAGAGAIIIVLAVALIAVEETADGVIFPTALGIGMYYVSLAIGFGLIERANVALYDEDMKWSMGFLVTIVFLGPTVNYVRAFVLYIHLFIVSILTALAQDKSTRFGHMTFARRFVLLTLFFTYAVLAWAYLLGGWHGV
jgi:hypothetical protein